MKENIKKDQNKSCLTSISFSVLGICIILFEMFSLIMSIICFVSTTWNFVKNFIKVMNIISLVMISLIIIINVCIFINIKTTKHNIMNNFRRRMTVSFFLLIFYLLLIIFNIYNAIYLSINLHIADYPEYGGRQRDQDYIDKHPDEFGDVSLQQFIIVGFCPSMISVLNLVSLILCVLFRKKMINLYNQMYDENNAVNIITLRHQKHRHTHSVHSSHSNQSQGNNPIRSPIRSPKRKQWRELNLNKDDINKNNNTKPNTNTNTERNNYNNNNTKKNQKVIKIIINTSEDEDENGPKKSDKHLINNNDVFDSKENFSDEKQSSYKDEVKDEVRDEIKVKNEDKNEDKSEDIDEYKYELRDKYEDKIKDKEINDKINRNIMRYNSLRNSPKKRNTRNMSLHKKRSSKSIIGTKITMEDNEE